MKQKLFLIFFLFGLLFFASPVRTPAVKAACIGAGLSCAGNTSGCCEGYSCQTTGRSGWSCLSNTGPVQGAPAVSAPGPILNAPGPTPSGPQCEDTGINTAIGCIHVLDSPTVFAGSLLKWGIGIGGGAAFLLIVYAGFMIMTSAGNPERLKAGQELLTSAISGLILLIFSIFILNFIGVDVLGLCKFGFGKAC